MALLSDLSEIKAVLGIASGDTSQDVKLGFFIEWASDLIEEALDRKGLFYKERTEYYNGTGTQKLLLKSRPVYTTPTIQVWVDDNGFWGTASGAFTGSDAAKTYGDDFGLVIDQDDGTSRSGILFRMNSYWPKPAVREVGYLTSYIGQGRGNIKVTYTGGYKLDLLPPAFRLVTAMIVSRLRVLVPQAWPITSESYEERSVSYQIPDKWELMSIVREMLNSYNNRTW